MPDDELDPNQPPDEPPGAPELNPTPEPAPARASGANPPAAATPAAPSPSSVFSDEQIGKLASGISSGLLNGLRPPAPTGPATYQPPPGPTPDELQARVNQLDEQIDLAVTEGKPIGALISQRDKFRDQLVDINLVRPIRQQGSIAVNRLTLANAKRDHADLFRLYERELMQLLNPSLEQGFMLTDEIVNEACNLVAGRHQKELFQLDREAEIRQQKLAAASPQPGATSGRARSIQSQSPQTIEARFGAPAEAAMQTKRAKGIDEDQMARRLGYKNKAEWFAKDDELSRPENAGLGLDSAWDRKNQRWVGPDELNEFYNG